MVTRCHFYTLLEYTQCKKNQTILEERQLYFNKCKSQCQDFNPLHVVLHVDIDLVLSVLLALESQAVGLLLLPPLLPRLLLLRCLMLGSDGEL